MDAENPTTDLLNILSKAMDAKVYGSIEIYLEEGQITQISQRVIKKIKKPNRSENHQIKVKRSAVIRKNSSSEVSIKL